ncbi:MAG: hypothetical protein HYV40_03220, partial [Candidatus Levybacteria bacterium]|nr:hypothetical protein [Candidatus Levybacteria bacterium]
METDQGRLLKDVTLFLGREKIPYMITGAWSVIYYGRPRASHDIDFIVEVGKDDADRVVALFEKLSSEFLLQPEQIRRAIDEESMFNILHLPSTLKLDFWILG